MINKVGGHHNGTNWDIGTNTKCPNYQACSVDSDTKTCAGSYGNCREAMLEILGEKSSSSSSSSLFIWTPSDDPRHKGTDLRTNCACSGTAGDFRELFESVYLTNWAFEKMKTYDPQDFKIDVICTFAPVTKYRTYFGTFSMWIVNMVSDIS